MIVFALIGLSANAQKVKTKVTMVITKEVINVMTIEETAALINTGYSDSINIYAIEHMKNLFTGFVNGSMKGRNKEKPVTMPKDLRFFAGKIKTLPCKNKFKQIVADVFLRENGWNYSYDVCVFDSIVYPYCIHDSIYKERIMDGYLSALNCTASCIRCGTNMHYVTVIMTDKNFANWKQKYQDFLLTKVEVREFLEFVDLNKDNTLGEEMYGKFLNKTLSAKEWNGIGL